MIISILQLSNLRPGETQSCAGIQHGLSVWSLLLYYPFTNKLGIILVIAHLFILSEKKTERL